MKRDWVLRLHYPAEDVRFARTIERIQRILVSELQKIAVVHLYSHDIGSLVNLN